MNSQTKRTIAATMVLPAALAVAGAALVVGCDTGNGSGTEQPPVKSFTVSISGIGKVGQALTANVTRDAGVDGTASYVWKRGATVIGGNAGTYTLVDTDIDQPITVTVSVVGAGAKTSSAFTPQYANLFPTGSIKIENRSASLDSVFTNIPSFGGASMANRLNTVAPTIYSGVTKVIISDGTPKKVGTVLTINAADFISAGSGGALTGAINLALSNANSNPQLSSAKSLKGYAKVPGTIFV